MDEKPLGPLTLDEAEKWLLHLENIATIERDLGFATRLVLGALLAHLHKSEIMDSRSFILGLRDYLPHIEVANERLATETMIAELLQQLPELSPSAHGRRTDH